MKVERRFRCPYLLRLFSIFLISLALLSTWFEGIAKAAKISTMGNGLRYIIERREGTGVVAIQVWVRVGSSYEDANDAGITHFIEHLIFKGTERLKANEIASRIESLGGSINAYTSYDNTVYHVVVPKAAFEEGFRLLVDAVMNPIFPVEEVEKEKKVVLEEIKMGEDDPQRKLFKELFSGSYKGSPYGRPVIGYEETVRGITRDKISSYFNDHYRPDNMFLVIVGDVEKEAAEGLIKGIGGKGNINSKTEDAKNGGRRETQGRTNGSKYDLVLEREVKEGYLAISYQIPSILHEDIPALTVLGVILGDGESSRLKEELKNKRGVVTDCSTYIFTPQKTDGLFIVYASFNGRDYDRVTQEIDKEIKGVYDKGITAWELTKAKNMVNASFIYSEETVQDKARLIGYYYTLTGDLNYVEGLLKRVNSVTEADVKRVLKKYIIDGRPNRVVIVKKEGSNPYTFQLKNGMRCVINKNLSSASFAFRIGFPGGLKDEPEGKNGVFNLLSRMLLKGTEGMDATEIAKKIDLLAGEISPYNGKNVFGLSGRFLSKDIKEVFSLLKDIITSTKMREEELKRVKEDALSEIRQIEDDPIRYSFLNLDKILYKGHPYSKDPAGTEEDIRTITINDLERFYREHIGPITAVLAISGDVDEKEVESLFRDAFSEWNGNAQSLKRVVPVPVREEVFIPKELMQSHMIFGFLGPGLIDKDRYSVEVMDAILSGMGGRIHRILREERPYAYAVTFFNHMAYETGGMGVYVATDHKLTEKVREVVLTEIERIKEHGFAEVEVANAKRYAIGTHYIKMQANSAIATNMCLDTIYGLGADHFKRWPHSIEEVKKGDIDAAGRRYLLKDRMVEVTIGQRQ